MSDALQRVVITSPDPVAPEGHDQKMIDLAEGKATPPTSDRPAWLPEKFKTVEDLASSYKELEAKQSGAITAPAATPVVPVTPSATPSDPLAIDATNAAVVKAGLDMSVLNTEISTTGTLSEDSYAKLAAVGFDKAFVDNHVAGQNALVKQFETDVKSATPGGAEKYPEMVAWAASNMSPTEIAAFNTAVGSGNKDQARLAVAGLGASFTAAVGREPQLQGGRTGTASADVFESIAQMKAAMASKEYKTDPSFRAKVQAKLGRSSIM
jgi:hypothetical protein